MALSIPHQWTASAGSIDAELITVPATGNWLVAVITCRVVDGSAPVLSLADVSRNLWRLVATETTEASAQNTSAQLQAEVWVCPAARYDGWKDLAVYASAMAISADDVGSVATTAFEVAGMANGYLTVDSVRVGTASGATSMSLSMPAPAANCLVVGVAATDNGSGTVSSTGSGFTALTQASRTGPSLTATSQWKESAAAETITWSSTTSTNWAAVGVAIRVTGTTPAQPNPNWPATRWEVGLGYTMATPLGRVRWTDQTKRLMDYDGDRGIQGELGTAEQGQSDIVIRNDDGAYTPRQPGAASASAAGTTTTIKIPDSQAANIVKGDFFRLYTSSGVLKQFTVFQVVSTSSSGGTTTITFARADGTAGGALAATASGDLYIGTAIDLYTPYRLLMTWGGKTYIVGSGWLRDHVITYDGAHWSDDHAEAIDALEPLATSQDWSPLRGEIMRRRPYAYWPLDDPSGVDYAANASGRSGGILRQTTSKFGAGTNNTASFGSSTQQVDTGQGFTTGIIGDTASGWQQTGLTNTDGAAHKGYALVGTDASFPSLSGGITIFGVMLTTDINTAALTYTPTLVILRNGDPAAGVGQGSIIKLSIHDSTGGLGGRAQVTVWDKTTHASTTTPGPGGAQLGGIYSNPLPWALTITPTGWTAYVNGFSWSGSANLVSSFSLIDIGGEADAFYHGQSYNAVHAHIALFDRVLTAGEIDNLAQAAMYGLIDEWLNERVQRRLDTAGWRGGRALTASNVHADTDVAGSDTASAISDVASHEDGWLFIDAASAVQFRSRGATYYQVPRATLGENTAAGEIPYQPGLAPSYNPSFIYNTIQVSNANFQGHGQVDTTTLVAVDDGAVSRYRTRTLQRTTRLEFLEDAWHLGWWLLARYAYPAKRAEQVVIEAATDPTRWPLVLGVEVGDLLIVQKRPLGAPSYSFRTRVLRVQPRLHWSHDGQVTGSVVLTLAAAPPQVPIAGDSSYGTIGSTVMGA